VRFEVYPVKVKNDKGFFILFYPFLYLTDLPTMPITYDLMLLDGRTTLFLYLFSHLYLSVVLLPTNPGAAR